MHTNARKCRAFLPFYLFAFLPFCVTFLRPFLMMNDHLPSQARDSCKESSPRDAFLACSFAVRADPRYNSARHGDYRYEKTATVFSQFWCNSLVARTLFQPFDVVTSLAGRRRICTLSHLIDECSQRSFCRDRLGTNKYSRDNSYSNTL